MKNKCICNRTAEACLGERCTVRRHVEEVEHYKMLDAAYANKKTPLDYKKRGFCDDTKSL